MVATTVDTMTASLAHLVMFVMLSPVDTQNKKKNVTYANVHTHDPCSMRNES